jgi:protease-4
LRWRALVGPALNFDNGLFDVGARLPVAPLDGILLGAGVDLRARVNVLLSFCVERMLATVFNQTAANASGPQAFAVEVGLRAQRWPSIAVRTPEIIEMDLEGDLSSTVHGPVETPWFRHNDPSASEMIRGLALDENVQALHLQISSLRVGWAMADDIRREIIRFQRTGKRVTCRLMSGSLLEVFVSSACGETSAAGSIEVFAQASSIRGIALTNADTSSMARDLRSRVVSEIARARRIERSELESAVDRTLTATEAKSLGLIDELAAPPKLAARFPGPDTISIGYRPRFVEPKRIAVVPISGFIEQGASTHAGGSNAVVKALGTRTGADTVIDTLERLAKDPRVAAIVLRVNSAGGDVAAADAIALAIKKVDREKPVLSSFGDMAEGSAYLIGAAARRIYAEPDTLMGALTAKTERFDLDELLSDALASSPITRTTTATRSQATEELAPEVVVAATQRNGALTKSVLARLFSGVAARGMGLVDDLGGLVDATMAARAAAGIREDSPLVMVLEARMPSAENRGPRKEAGPAVVGFVLVEE